MRPKVLLNPLRVYGRIKISLQRAAVMCRTDPRTAGVCAALCRPDAEAVPL